VITSRHVHLLHIDVDTCTCCTTNADMCTWCRKVQTRASVAQMCRHVHLLHNKCRHVHLLHTDADTCTCYTKVQTRAPVAQRCRHVHLLHTDADTCTCYTKVQTRAPVAQRCRHVHLLHKGADTCTCCTMTLQIPNYKVIFFLSPTVLIKCFFCMRVEPIAYPLSMQISIWPTCKNV